MPREAKTLTILANPYCALDHQGRLSGAFPHERSAGPFDSGFVAPSYVGARLEATELRAPRPGFEGRYDRTWSFSGEPETVPNTPHYRNAVRSREVLAADQATAIAASVPFVEPKKALELERAGAILKWQGLHGKDDTPDFLKLEAFASEAGREQAKKSVDDKKAVRAAKE